SVKVRTRGGDVAFGSVGKSGSFVTGGAKGQRRKCTRQSVTPGGSVVPLRPPHLPPTQPIRS
ncbi:ATP-sensitive inward rectifier potassium channel 8, partial [Dissostichus eleginoides]